MNITIMIGEGCGWTHLGDNIVDIKETLVVEERETFVDGDTMAMCLWSLRPSPYR